MIRATFMIMAGVVASVGATCVNEQGGCAICNAAGTECVQCEQNYLPNVAKGCDKCKASAAVDAADCENGCKSTTACCSDATDNCLNCATAADKCKSEEACPIGFSHMNADVCVGCHATCQHSCKPESGTNTPAAADCCKDYCAICGGTGPACTNCYNGAVLTGTDEGLCNCADNYANSPCKTCGEGKACAACEAGFSLYDAVCHACSSTCTDDGKGCDNTSDRTCCTTASCKECAVAATCDACMPGFTLTDAKACIQCDSSCGAAGCNAEGPTGCIETKACVQGAAGCALCDAAGKECVLCTHEGTSLFSLQNQPGTCLECNAACTSTGCKDATSSGCCTLSECGRCDVNKDICTVCAKDMYMSGCEKDRLCSACHADCAGKGCHGPGKDQCCKSPCKAHCSATDCLDGVADVCTGPETTTSSQAKGVFLMPLFVLLFFLSK